MQTEAVIRKLKREHSAALLQQPGVCGVGVEKEATGGFVLTVHLSEDSAAVRESVRRCLGSAPVKLVHSGPFQAQAESHLTKSPKSAEVSPRSARS